MTDLTKSPRSGLFLRSARIVTGLYLLFFVTSHLLNLSLGLISINAMDAARPYLSGVMTGPVTGLILTFMLFMHYLIGLWSIYKKPVLRGTTQDIVQIVTGVLVLPLLAAHAIGISMLEQSGVDFGYRNNIQLFWVSDPRLGLLQVIMLSVVWVHGCAGLFTWLRSKPNAVRALMWLYPLGVAIPVVALLGYVQAGRDVLIQDRNTEVSALASNDGYETDKTPASDYGYETDSATVEPTVEPTVLDDVAPPQIPYALIKQVTSYTIWISSALAVLVFLARALRIWIASTSPVRISSGTAPPISSNSGTTLLDAFRANDRPHANLCVGRGRCGTCAVRIISSDFPLAAPSALEQGTLKRIGLGPQTRLACQLELTSGGALSVEPIYPPGFSFVESDDDDADTQEPLGATS